MPRPSKSISRPSAPPAKSKPEALGCKRKVSDEIKIKAVKMAEEETAVTEEQEQSEAEYLRKLAENACIPRNLTITQE